MRNHKAHGLGILIGMLLLMVGSAASAALPPRISWTPAQLTPASMAPGTSTSHTVVLKHTGILPIPFTNQLRIVAEGAVAPFVTITQPKFPALFKRGNQVTFQVTISLPANTPAGEIKGSLLLKRILSGRETVVWRADSLPISIQVSQGIQRISWNIPSLNVEALNGTVVVKSASFKVNKSITNPAFQIETLGGGVSPTNLASFIEIQSSKSTAITESDEVKLGVVFRVTSDIPDGEYVGALHVLDGSKAITPALSVHLKVSQGSATTIPDNVAFPTSERITSDSSTGRSYVLDEAQVTLHRGADIQQFMQLVSSEGGVILGGVPELGIYQIRFPSVISNSGHLDDYIDRLNQHPSVKAAVRAWKLDQNMEPNDPAYKSFWNEQVPDGRNAPLEYIRLPSAWNSVYNGTTNLPKIAIAVVDTAFNLGHTDLIDNINAQLSESLIDPPSLQPGTNGYDPVTDRALAHGTLVAGVIGASADNGIGVTGVLWNANLRLLSTYTSIDEADLGNYGLIWPAKNMLRAVREGAKVINYSAGLTVGPEGDVDMQNSTFEALINEVCNEIPLDEKGNLPPCARSVLFVFGADNHTDISADFKHTSPASLSLSYENVISVTRIEARNYPLNKPFDPYIESQLEIETDYVPKLELLAQGGDVTVAAPGFVYTTAPGNDYARAGGTSFATPIVTGLAGLILTKNPGLTPAEVRKVIVEGACRGGKRVSNSIIGKPDIKVIDAYETVVLADNPKDLTCQALTPPTPTIKLNDTGITTCSNDSTNGLACPVAGFPGQDGEHGRDAQALAGTLQKVGGGHGGFDFTKLDSSGNQLPASATAWDCVKDNVTGLVWEVKTTSGLRSMNNTYSWYEPDNSKNGGSAGTQNGGSCTGSLCDTYGYVQAVNAQGLCGASDWRMPDVNELLSIVNNATVNPAIDTNYFSNSPASNVWSSSPYADYSNYAWYVSFNYGGVNYDDYDKPNGNHVRLVRGGQ